MNSLRRLRLAPFLLWAVALAQTPVAAPVSELPEPVVPKKPQKSQWVFSIVPRAFQKNPFIDLTVITEMTELGKQQPPASAAAPVYYMAESSGYHQMGQAAGGEKPLKQEDVDRLLSHALATNGFLPAAPPEHPPTLIIFYTWGSHNILVEGDANNPSLSADQVARNLLDRAALVGGYKFSQDMLKLFQEADDMATLNSTPIKPVLGAAQMEFFNPINRFREADPKNDFLFQQFTNDVYYVVASAYDYASITSKVKRLYWRTRMTVAANGVSQEQTMPTLIVSAAPYFGKDMSEPEIITRKAVPEGTVEIGTPVVVPSEPDGTKKETPAKKP